MKWRTFLFGLAVGGTLAGCGKSSDKPQAAPKTVPAETVAEPTGPDVSKLAAALKNTRPERLQTAIDMAMQIDARGDNPIPTLIEALKDPNSGGLGETLTEKANSTREAAVMALLKLGPKGKTALISDGVNLLKAGLKDAKPTVREHTANAFMMMGIDAKPFAEDIAPLAGAKEMAVRAAAYRALEKSKAPASPTILKLLLSDDSGVASDAAASLSINKPTGADAVPHLVAALKRTAPESFSGDQLSYVKNRSAEALAGLGKNAEAAIPDLVELLQKATVDDIEKILIRKDPNDRSPPVPGQVLALRKLGMAATPQVLPLLKSDQAIIRYQAALVFGGIPLNAASKELLPEVQTALLAERNLPSGQMYVYVELMKAAIRLGAEPEAMIKQPLEMLKSEDKDDRSRGVSLLRILGPKAVSGVPALRELLADPEIGIQRSALSVLRIIGPGAKDAAPEVAKLAESKDMDVSREAVQTLRVIGSTQPTAVPTLIKLLGSNDRNVVIETAQAISSIGPGAAEAVGPLVKLLNEANTHAEERTAILSALGGIGSAAKEAIPAVTKFASDRDSPQLRSAAVLCLGKIAPYDSAIGKLLAERLKDSTTGVRIDTLRTFAGYGPKAAASAPDIKAMMDSTKAPDLKIWCAAALVVLGIDADKNAGVIFENLKPKLPTATRMAAMDGLVLIGDKAKPALPDLLEALKDKNPAPKNGVSIREKAVTVCGRLPLLTKPAISPITDLLKDADKQIRKSAAEALGAYGPEAIVAVPKLREAADADDVVLREAARKALERIVPDKKMMEEAS
ncbi:HEAT repeat domain-containing protein [Zavarzinella formosa]|uniref:HEAT repeat domain-containing protein n=1 Tax=Zavarzinella formosa TaxID=360055 RepID=UPI000312BE46|nr:HEAT repeat domain-containing protein [Zavarzinella formosa]